MAKIKKIFCFTHFDLDGVVSYLVTKWAHPEYDVEYKTLIGMDMRQDINEWMLTHDFTKYEKVYFLDLDMSSCSDLIDKENVILIDHHKSHVQNLKYKKAIPIIKEYSSACLLAYKAFKKLYNINFTDQQKKLIIYGNDYDSYSHEFIESKILNAIFWNTQKSFETFCENFKDGFHDFTRQQMAIYDIYTEEIEKIIKSLTIFKGIYADVDGECRTVLATFAEKHINDISDYLIKNYKSDVIIIVNCTSKHVSFRRPPDSTMRLDVFAKDLADGGGHEYSAGGTITKYFLEFTKTLNPI